MECPHCGSQDRSVVESRFIGGMKRRRNRCNNCDAFFGTYEINDERLGQIYKLIEAAGAIDINALLRLSEVAKTSVELGLHNSYVAASIERKVRQRDSQHTKTIAALPGR